MPFLDICHENGELIPWATGRLYAAMLYPCADEEGEREQIFEEMLLSGLYTFEPEIENMSEDNKAWFERIYAKASLNLHRAGSGSDTLLVRANRRAAEGLLAGRMLHFRLRCARHRPDKDDASLNKAEHFVTELFADLKKSKTKAIPISKTMIGKYWRTHRAACHLQAAALACEDDGVEDWLAYENISSFLMLSEIYRSQAESNGILNLSETWTPPPSFRCSPLDLSKKALDSLFPPLTNAEIETLEKYTARW